MSLPSPVLTYHSVALPVSVRLENQHVDAHAAVEVIPEVMVEFSTEDDKDDDEEEGEHVEQERNIVPGKRKEVEEQHQQLGAITEADDTHGTSDEFAYPTNLGIAEHDHDSDLDELVAPSTIKKNPTATTTTTTTTTTTRDGQLRQEREGEDDDPRNRFKSSHSRIDNSSGSDLVQVTVEDLLISEELNQTIRASKSQGRRPGNGLASIVQQQHPQPSKQAENVKVDVDESQAQHHQQQRSSGSNSTTSSNNASPRITRTTITATIRTTGVKTRSIHFDDDGSPVVVPENQQSSSSPPQSSSSSSSLSQETQARQNQQEAASKPQEKTPPRKTPRPPAPRILTPAQQREAEADDNIQKAIELHENNQLEEATHYFALAAQSENPLGQLMYGLSLRHGWGCKPNPAEAIKFLQRAAEYAMGELHELNPSKFAAAAALSQESQQPPSGLAQDPEKQWQQQQQQQRSAQSGGPQHALRRMGSMDRKEAITMARKELVMALYELGMSYLKGWGVAKDKYVAFTYFKIAADLGDADSQNETALCYYEGIGVAKDMFESARYYRMAAAQGATQLGNSWIWKPKYDQYCAAENAAATIGTTTTSSSTATSKKNRLSTAIQSALHGSSSAAAKNTSTQGRPRRHSTAASTSPMGGSPPLSPSIPNPHYSIASIASGLASVTAATAGTVAPNSIRQSLISPITSSSSSSSLASISSPTSPISPASPVLNTTPPTSTSEWSEKKKGRWSIWGRSSTTNTTTATATTTTQPLSSVVASQ
ncbi:MAG: hypothetical protein J3Q66DRAFT_370584 [Benniella sp.]|nr:MAG: hypothetical protein J3Q66DRAFT_370584 [Benniella sp.]